jgi:hypothetical protein
MISVGKRFLLGLLIAMPVARPAVALPPWKPKFQELYVDGGPQSLKDAFADNVIGSCKVCHVNGQEKTVRNPFGEALDRLIEGDAGKRLTAAGWCSWNTKKPLELGKWVVADGALTLGRGGGDIYTEEAFENFELELEWKTTGNSGILIRVNPAAGKAIYDVAPEMQIERRTGDSKTAAAALYDIYSAEGEQLIHPDGWNKVRIRLVNGEGTHWFNGHQVYSYKIGSDDWNSRIQASKWKNSKGFAETAKGHIGLQDHGNGVSFRNIKIRPVK